MVLKFVEQDQIFRDFLLEALAPLEAAVGARTGAMLKHRGFVFISSPGSVTPLHFDPEHNILLQVRGTKTMTIFAARRRAGRAGAGARALPRRRPPQPALARRIRRPRQRLRLEPGKAVHVPFMAPHLVRNGPGVSISFSITWRSEWSYREEYAHRMNSAAAHRPA